MQPNDVGEIVQYLQRLYGERFQELTQEMKLLWLKTLRPFPFDLAHLAVERWATSHLPRHAPSLADLATLAEELQREQRKAMRESAQKPGTDGKDAEELVQDRDDLLSDGELRAYLDAIYAHCDEQAARLARAEADASAAVNPPNPQRWLPLTEDFSPESRQWIPRTGSQGLTQVMDTTNGKDA